jgi:hypothetical protein
MEREFMRGRALSEGMIEQTAGMIAMRDKLNRMIERNRRLTIMSVRFEHAQPQYLEDMQTLDAETSNAAA